MATISTERSFPQVLHDVVANLLEIARCELRLARTEFKEEAAKAARPALTFAAGLASGLYGLAFLLAASFFALATVMAAWMAALLVGGILALLAAVLLSLGARKLRRISFVPRKTIQSLEENVQWAKHPSR